MPKFFLSILVLFFSQLADAQVPKPKVFGEHPWPNSDGVIKTIVCNEPSFRPQVQAFIDALHKLGGTEVVLGEGEGRLIFNKSELKKGLTHMITAVGDTMIVVAEDPEGVAHATSTLLQHVKVDKAAVSLPILDIQDGPDHQYRSFMVDMGRNPHSPKTLRQVVDMMWLAKANYLQLHLTDDQLFSWPSKAFPKLYSKRAGWTWEDFEALEKYSQARGVTIIPEIDVPGHSTLLRKHYPEVFGKNPTELATKPEAQKGMETLIKELFSVFKATPYFHMGGDEAYGVPQNDQRDFINRLNIFVKSQGKKMLVWEGPHLGKGENKVATDVIHINWRSIEFPLQQMLDAGYQVVSAPWDPLYVVDHYPKTMFTAVDVKRCYNWNVRRTAHINHEMATFKKPDFVKSAKNVLGFCMPWWEGREENILPLCYPRFTAVASAAWNRKGESDFEDYQRRAVVSQKVFEKISGYQLPALPVADPATQKDNLAYLAKVTPSDSETQPHFGPQRLTNGITDRFDHFLGYPTRPKPLEISIELKSAGEISRIVIHERAIGKSHEVYDLFVSNDGVKFSKIGSSKEGTRGKNQFVEHKFDSQKVSHIKIVTQGCHGLTFPSFSRLSEVQAFAN